MKKDKMFICSYDINNDNWETIKTGLLRCFTTDLGEAEEHFHDQMLDLMGSVDGADDYFLSEMREVV